MFAAKKIALSATVIIYLLLDAPVALAYARPDARPIILQEHPYEVELLEDSFLRKQPRALHGNRDEARRKISQWYPRRRGFLQGQMAEAIFIDRHRGWGYVQSPTATQHDAFFRVAGRPAPYTAQVKFHQSGRPNDYARDMKNDWRSGRFVVPDDHVQPLKDLLRARAEAAQAEGFGDRSQRYWRDYSRVQRLGATSTEVIEKTRSAADYSRRFGQTAKYAAFGSIVGGSVSNIIGQTREEAAWALANSFAQASVYEGSDNFLAKRRPSALTRGAGAQVILASVVTITNISFLLRKYGANDAVRDPRFYDQVGEGISTFTAGHLVGKQLARRSLSSVVSGPLFVFVSTAAVAQAAAYAYRKIARGIRLHRDPDAEDKDFLKDAAQYRSECSMLGKRLRDPNSSELGFRCRSL